MKKILYSNITAGVDQPFTKKTWQHLQEAFYDMMLLYARALWGEQIENFSTGAYPDGDTTGVYVICGLEEDTTSVPNYAIPKGGIVYYNGELYPYYFTGTGYNSTYYLHIKTSYATGDPIQFSDGNTYNVHETKEIEINATAAGAICSSLTLNRLPIEEDWHYVGAVGEPAFQNSWVNFGGSYVDLRFKKDLFGFLHIEGYIKSGTEGTVAFTLPSGYRPSDDSIVIGTGVNNGSGAYSGGQIGISHTTGDVTINCATGYTYVAMTLPAFKVA